MSMGFLLPPILHNAQGEVRKVGFEIEFAELNLEDAAHILVDLFGGTIKKNNKFSMEVIGTTIGNFSLQIDARLLTEKSYEKLWKKAGRQQKDDSSGSQTLDTNLENALDSIASKIIPYEISTPPIPLDSLVLAEKIRMTLFEKGAKGTSSSVFYAFATHINPELPFCDITTLLAYLRAFLLLYPWIMEKVAVNFTRKLTAFINPFTDEYIALVLDTAYNPSLSIFIDDYYKFNPDRNRPLDLYPVLAFLDKGKIEKLKGLGKVNPRPTLHYRVPNSMIDDPAWSLAKEWNTWVQVEKLAAEAESIERLSKEYRKLEGDTMIGFKNKWNRYLKEEWIDVEN